MKELALYNTEGQETGDISLNEEIFGVEINEHVVHRAVTAQLAAKRTGTASTKTRSEVRGGGRKPWRQKGTGRARHGSIRSPLWVGGGTTFGPSPERNYEKDIPKKEKKLAVKSALTDKVNEEDLIFVDGFGFARPKTKQMVEVLNNLDLKDRKVLVVLSGKDENVYKSARNIPGVRVTIADYVTVYDIVNCDKLVMVEDALEQIEEVLTTNE